MKINEMKIILMQLGHRLDLRYAVNVGMDQPIGNREVRDGGRNRRGTRSVRQYRPAGCRRPDMP